MLELHEPTGAGRSSSGRMREERAELLDGERVPAVAPPDKRWLLAGSFTVLFVRYCIATFLSSFFTQVDTPPCARRCAAGAVTHAFARAGRVTRWHRRRVHRADIRRLSVRHGAHIARRPRDHQPTRHTHGRRRRPTLHIHLHAAVRFGA